ncbi:uncharacterized protein MYCFIDRAFT_174854 [Pseudocercospora fijiensis CIRAD86]|uniref:Uncharacterized protein n=1 Tax=Pseudocercospora fijiensis (strain CIRAD86) TaxID=383855 RepID=M2ZWP4_PSEFD|nr:uncharacterized protein MYCFIDRAFT_174854 [Pseudocercospora fijiensis CIRAD86]EME83419.1 hypothetical protein MYCFIDRAFT_174854 [Pseudocercospora fijiensis CIRAD86]
MTAIVFAFLGGLVVLVTAARLLALAESSGRGSFGLLRQMLALKRRVSSHTRHQRRRRFEKLEASVHRRCCDDARSAWFQPLINSAFTLSPALLWIQSRLSVRPAEPPPPQIELDRVHVTTPRKGLYHWKTVDTISIRWWRILYIKQRTEGQETTKKAVWFLSRSDFESIVRRDPAVFAPAPPRLTERTVPEARPGRHENAHQQLQHTAQRIQMVWFHPLSRVLCSCIARLVLLPPRCTCCTGTISIRIVLPSIHLVRLDTWAACCRSKSLKAELAPRAANRLGQWSLLSTKIVIAFPFPKSRARPHFYDNARAEHAVIAKTTKPSQPWYCTSDQPFTAIAFTASKLPSSYRYLHVMKLISYMYRLQTPRIPMQTIELALLSHHESGACTRQVNFQLHQPWLECADRDVYSFTGLPSKGASIGNLSIVCASSLPRRVFGVSRLISPAVDHFTDRSIALHATRIALAHLFTLLSASANALSISSARNSSNGGRHARIPNQPADKKSWENMPEFMNKDDLITLIHIRMSEGSRTLRKKLLFKRTRENGFQLWHERIEAPVSQNASKHCRDLRELCGQKVPTAFGHVNNNTERPKALRKLREPLKPPLPVHLSNMSLYRIHPLGPCSSVLGLSGRKLERIVQWIVFPPQRRLMRRPAWQHAMQYAKCSHIRADYLERHEILEAHMLTVVCLHLRLFSLCARDFLHVLRAPDLGLSEAPEDKLH